MVDVAVKVKHFNNRVTKNNAISYHHNLATHVAPAKQHPAGSCKDYALISIVACKHFHQTVVTTAQIGWSLVSPAAAAA
jgi:hypothetical protein